MNCGTSSRDPDTDTGADIREVIHMSKGFMAAKKLNMKLKIVFLCIFFLRKYTCLFSQFSNRLSEIIILIVLFFHAPIVIFHYLLLFLLIHFNI